MASAGLVSAIPALYLVTKRELLWWETMSWLAAVSLLGVFMAIPLKRQLINIDKLPFPTGLATAETLKSMHTAGAEAVDKARSLFLAAGVGALVGFSKTGFAVLGKILVAREATKAVGEKISAWVLPDEFPLLPWAKPESAAHSWLEKYTVGFESSTIMIAAGAIMGIRVGASLLVGAIFFYGIMGPYLIEWGWAKPGYRGLVSWTLWPATAMMVTSGLLSFALRWRTVVRSFRGLAALVGGKRVDDPLDHVEVPGSWFIGGVLVAGAACVLLGHWRFGITWWMGILAVAITMVLSIVAARATGETDVTPIGAMGKITQLTYGVIAPANPTTNLMTASITAGAASHAADLLTDLKSGYLLGGNPRKQTISQLFGVLAGTLFCVPVYALIVKPESLGSKELPAPAAKVWAAVAEMMNEGTKALPQGALIAMAVGGALGILLTLLEEYLPKEKKKFLPSATGLGIAGVVPAFNSISMFLGALIAWIISKRAPTFDEKYTIPVSSGLIAGESLISVALILIDNAPSMWEQLRGVFEL